MKSSPKSFGRSTRNGIASGIAAALLGVVGIANADPINFLPPGVDFSIKFVNREIEITQLGQELFGLINITQINSADGTITYWNGNGADDGTQLVGYFENLIAVADQTGGAGLSFTGGNFALFNVANGTFSPGTSPNTKDYLNQVCGGSAVCLANPWLTADFVPGINDSINGNASLQAAFATTNVQAGFGYMSVAGIGTNNARFDTNGFTFNNFAAADLFLRSNFVIANQQTCIANNGWSVCSDDPVIGRTVPEPGTLALFGLAALAAGAVRRKKVA